MTVAPMVMEVGVSTRQRWHSMIGRGCTSCEGHLWASWTSRFSASLSERSDTEQQWESQLKDLGELSQNWLCWVGEVGLCCVACVLCHCGVQQWHGTINAESVCSYGHCIRCTASGISQEGRRTKIAAVISSCTSQHKGGKENSQGSSPLFMVAALIMHQMHSRANNRTCTCRRTLQYLAYFSWCIYNNLDVEIWHQYFGKKYSWERYDKLLLPSIRF